VFNAAEYKHVHYREREHAPKRGLDHPNFTGRLHSSSRGVVVLIRIWDAKTTKASKTRSGRCPFVLLLIRDDWLWFWWECCLEPYHSKSELPGDRYRHFGQHYSYPDSHRGSSINEGLEPLSRIYIWVTRLTRRRHPKVFRKPPIRNSNLQTRLQFVNYGARHTPKTTRCCCVCQRDLNVGQHCRYVYLTEGMEAVYPEDIARRHCLTDLGFHPIGMDCARTLGLEWTTESDIGSQNIPVPG
jgi:hypothetical protein